MHHKICLSHIPEYYTLLVHGHELFRLQVNASPSLATDTVADFNLKFAMVDAALTLADVAGNYASGKPPASLNGFDLIWEHTSPVHVRFSPAPCHLVPGMYLHQQGHRERAFPTCSLHAMP
jgi:hypothetical protein